MTIVKTVLLQGAIVVSMCFAAGAVQAKSGGGLIDFDRPQLCQTYCNLNANATAGVIDSVISEVPGRVANGQTLSSLPLGQRNPDRATRASQSKCQELAQNLCLFHEYAPNFYERCDAIRVTRGSAIMQPISVRCH